MAVANMKEQPARKKKACCSDAECKGEAHIKTGKDEKDAACCTNSDGSKKDCCTKS